MIDCIGLHSWRFEKYWRVMSYLVPQADYGEGRLARTLNNPILTNALIAPTVFPQTIDYIHMPKGPAKEVNDTRF